MEENKKGISDKIALPLSIIIAGLLIGGGIYMNGRLEQNSPSPAGAQNTGAQNRGSASLKQSLRPIDANDHVLGSANARIVIVEYSDTECPFCKMFHDTMNTVMQEYGSRGEVAWVYRHFPIPELHSKAAREAEALECAAVLGGNSKFWEYTNKIYEVTPSNDGLDLAELPKIATQVGLSSSEFTTCLDGGEFTPRVRADIINAQEIGASGTPFSVLIDTKTGEYYPLEGAYPYNQLKQAIDLILQS